MIVEDMLFVKFGDACGIHIVGCARIVRLAQAALLNCSKSEGEPITIRIISAAARQRDPSTADGLQPEFEGQSVMDFEESIGNMDAEIRVDADQVCVNAAWWIFDNGSPFETTGWPNSTSASTIICAASRRRGSGKWEIAHLPPYAVRTTSLNEAW